MFRYIYRYSYFEIYQRYMQFVSLAGSGYAKAPKLGLAVEQLRIDSLKWS